MFDLDVKRLCSLGPIHDNRKVSGPKSFLLHVIFILFLFQFLTNIPQPRQCQFQCNLIVVSGFRNTHRESQ